MSPKQVPRPINNTGLLYITYIVLLMQYQVQQSRAFPCPADTFNDEFIALNDPVQIFYQPRTTQEYELTSLLTWTQTFNQAQFPGCLLDSFHPPASNIATIQTTSSKLEVYTDDEGMTELVQIEGFSSAGMYILGVFNVCITFGQLNPNEISYGRWNLDNAPDDSLSMNLNSQTTVSFSNFELTNQAGCNSALTHFVTVLEKSNGSINSVSLNNVGETPSSISVNLDMDNSLVTFLTSDDELIGKSFDVFLSAI